MASRIVVDEIDVNTQTYINMKHNVHLSANLTSSDTNHNFKNNVIEQYWSVCDGSSRKLHNCTVTSQNVTTNMSLPNSYVDITGSTITYTPPEGCIGVKYEFYFMLGWNDDHCISHWRFYLDNTEIIYARRSLSGRYMEQYEPLTWYIAIGGDTNWNTGRQQTWNTPKTMKWQGRDYGSSNERERVHLTQYWDGGGTDMFSAPQIGITAYKAIA